MFTLLKLVLTKIILMFQVLLAAEKKNIPEKKVKISNDGDLCNSHLWVPTSLSSNWAHNLLVLMGF